MRVAATIVALLVLVALPARALDMAVTEGGRALLLHGQFKPGDDERLDAMLSDRGRGVTSIRLNSPGGNMEAGMDVGRVIRDRRLSTYIEPGQTCASACVLAFLGGAVREVHAKGRVGVHMASAIRNQKYIDGLKKILAVRDYDLDTKVRAIMLLNEQGAAVAAGALAIYFSEMGISLRLLEPSLTTDHLDVHWLTRAEMRDYNVVNVD